jgi:hypothetical protein
LYPIVAIMFVTLPTPRSPHLSTKNVGERHC